MVVMLSVLDQEVEDDVIHAYARDEIAQCSHSNVVEIGVFRYSN